MDLNEIAMNLVPFPRLHYLVPSLSPLYTLSDVNFPNRRSVPQHRLQLRLSSDLFHSFSLLRCCLSFRCHRLDQIFSEAFSKDHQLIRADPKRSLYLACAIMVRGNIQISDIRRNIERSELNLPTKSPLVSKRWVKIPSADVFQIVAPFISESPDL